MSRVGRKIAALPALLVCMTACDPGAGRRAVVTPTPDVWLIADLHSHTVFSDGRSTPAELVERAVANGCDILAVTDHTNAGMRGGTDAYFDAIGAQRDRHPGLLLFGGVEWNVPPYAGREHVTVLTDVAHERELARLLRTHFDGTGDVGAALRYAAQVADGEHVAAFFYNHPSRQDDDVLENLGDIATWRTVNGLMIGFEGGPGHQRAEPIGHYEARVRTIDRWDPVVAEIGGVWDRLLDAGHDVWGAHAVSDFHNDRSDEAPCAFARTHVQVTERSLRGVVDALRAGAFWADHGRILDALEVSLTGAGLVEPVRPGGTAQASAADDLQLQVVIRRGAGARDAPLVVEVIGNARSGRPELLYTQKLAPGTDTLLWPVGRAMKGADGRSTWLRVRVRKVIGNGPDLMAYTNPVRVEWR